MPEVAPTVLHVDRLFVDLGNGRGRVSILRDVGFDLRRAETLGVVGESGSGKSTLAKALVGLVPIRNGEVVFDGIDVRTVKTRARRAAMRRMQLIPQNPYASLDPHRTIGQTLAEALDPRRADTRGHRERIQELLASVLLDPDAAAKYPHEFSGGQRQRIAIARALAVQPALIIADEITSALDVTTQAEVLRLLSELQTAHGFAMIFISHDLSVVRRVSDQVLVLLRGDVVEHGAVDDVYDRPSAPYTRRLLDSVPGGPAFAVRR